MKKYVKIFEDGVSFFGSNHEILALFTTALDHLRSINVIDDDDLKLMFNLLFYSNKKEKVK